MKSRLEEQLREWFEYGYSCDDVTIEKTVSETSSGIDRLDCLADALELYLAGKLDRELTAALDAIFVRAVRP
jgi:hypothetical protein